MITLTNGERFETVATEVQASAFINQGWAIVQPAAPAVEEPVEEPVEEQVEEPVEEPAPKTATEKPKRTGGRKKTEA